MVNVLPGLDAIAWGLGLLLAGIVAVVVLWLGWRKPTLVLLLALTSLAIRPELLWGGSDIGYEWGLHQSLIVLALAMNALRYGVRRTINWPIVALVASFLLSLAFGHLHPDLTLPFMLMSLALLALPFAFTQVVLEPGSRRALALVIMVTPLLSVALGGLLQLLGLREVFSYERWVGDWYRLEGGVGDAASFAALATAGFAVALHEATRPGRPYAVPLAVVNLVLVIFSGTRMAMLASFVFTALYLVLSPDLRELCYRQRLLLLLGGGVVLAAVAVYLPTLRWRMFGADPSGVQISGRDQAWSFFWDEWLRSPLFGRGVGAGFVAAREALADWALPTPHNEYLHLLVIGGVIGLALVAGAVFLWYRQLVGIASDNDRAFLLALAPTVAIYAMTDNIWLYSGALALYAYLSILLTAPQLWAAVPGAAGVLRYRARSGAVPDSVRPA
jgi:teichuronic acid biosynthesis protein TuaE